MITEIQAVRKGDTHSNLNFVNFYMLEVNLCKNFNFVITEYYCSHCILEAQDMNLSVFYFIKEYLGNLFILLSRLYLYVIITNLIILSFFNQPNIHYLMTSGTSGVILSDNIDDSCNTRLWEWIYDGNMS